MRIPRALSPVLLAPLALGLGCQPKGSKAPAWVRAAPAGCAMVLSVQAGWVLDQQNLQTLLTKFPMADQMLDLFLKRARISPKEDPGRVTFYVLDLPQKGHSNPKDLARGFLVLLDGFKDPGALQAAVVETFPQEGSLPMDGKEAALHVILDVDQLHFRAAVEPGGRIWLGDLSALSRRAEQGPLKRIEALRAAEWINSRATFQGLLQVEPLVGSLRDQLPKEWGLDLPRGMDSLAWSVTPAQEPKAPHRLELALTGAPEAVNRAAPWLQRIGALAATAGPTPAPPPDIVTERTRAGLRASLSDEQLNAVLAKLGQVPLRLPHRGPKA